MENVKRYEEHVIWKLLRWSGILVVVFGYIYTTPALLKSLKEVYIKQNWSEFIMGSIILLVIPIMTYIIIAVFIEFYRVAVKVELHEDRIVGYPWYGKKKFEMKYEEIEVIKDRSNTFPLAAITLEGKDRKMYLSVLVYPLATVVEEIERRAVNLKESRLKRLKRDSSLWVYGKDEEK